MAQAILAIRTHGECGRLGERSFDSSSVLIAWNSSRPARVGQARSGAGQGGLCVGGHVQQLDGGAVHRRELAGSLHGDVFPLGKIGEGKDGLDAHVVFQVKPRRT
jgi:hypothetical protein